MVCNEVVYGANSFRGVVSCCAKSPRFFFHLQCVGLTSCKFLIRIGRDHLFGDHDFPSSKVMFWGEVITGHVYALINVYEILSATCSSIEITF